MSQQDKQQKPTDFDEVCAFLSSSRAFADANSAPHANGAIKVIKTHAAIIFLGPDTAYKIKQPVTFDYLDFSTLEKRRAVCEREIEINKPNAPGLYNGLVPITRESDGSLAIDGEGKAIEYAIKMRRFDQQNLLHAIAERGEFDNDLAANIGNQIAAFHLGLAPETVDDGAHRIREIIDQIAAVFKSVEQHLPPGAPDDFLTNAATYHTRVAGALNRRGKEGMIRRCHGDLHLQNILLQDGKPTLFDALEFDERLAVIDVLYDLSFLIMDLNHLGLKQAANRLVSVYTLKAWPLIRNKGFRLLPLFMGLRAAIRAMVTAQSAEQSAAQPDNTRQQKQREAADYLNQAISYFTPPAPALIAVGGLSGSGKSTLAASLAPAMPGPIGAILLRSDVERKILFGVAELAPSPAAAYTPDNVQRVYDHIMEKADFILRQGQSILLDAVFSRPHERAAARDLAQHVGVAFTGLWLDAPGDCLYQRVAARRNDASDADTSVVTKQLTRIAGDVECENEGWIKIDASGSPARSHKNALEVIEPGTAA